ncbi:MAG: DUF445 domain-containing protein [Candidatus Muiribacteriota bacterium]
MEWLRYLIAPIAGAFIGYSTNYIAVKMLFHPRKQINFLGIKIQGIFPKRQKELAVSLGDVIEKELISHHDVNIIIEDPNLKSKLKEDIKEHFINFISTKAGDINPMLAMFLNDEIINKIKVLMDPEIDRILPEIINKLTREIEKELDFSEVVREKVEAFSMEKLEEILFAIMSKEFRFIELIGGFIGLLIGVLQSVIFLL